MRQQEPRDRIHNFNEVPFGYTEEEAVREAKRCLQCKARPCVTGCPAEVQIPEFIKAITDRDFQKAIKIIKETNNLPAVCGRVCPQEDQCELKCVLNPKGCPIDIGGLERFAADHEKTRKVKAPGSVGARVAVVGAGPGGLTCAADLAKMGYKVTVFEGLHKPGGVLSYGIPEFRLPKEIVTREVDYIAKLGVEVKLNYIIGRTKTIKGLKKEGYKAFFISTGAGLPYFMGIPGENLTGVYSANEFLTRVNLMKAYKFPEFDTPVTPGRKVGVTGAGNVAMDAARSALRLGAEEVHILYRRTEKEMPARIDEIERAKEEGVIFDILTSPVKILGDNTGSMARVRCIKNALGDPDESGRRRPIPVEGSEFDMELDMMIMAIGNGPNPLLLRTLPELELTPKGNIKTDGSCRTSMEGVYAGGDIVTGSATVIAAMGAGKRAARNIDKYLKKIDL